MEPRNKSNEWTVLFLILIVIVGFMVASTGCNQSRSYYEEQLQAEKAQLLSALSEKAPLWDAEKLPEFSPKFEAGDLVRHKLHGTKGIVVSADDERIRTHEFYWRDDDILVLESHFKVPYPESTPQNRTYSVRFAKTGDTESCSSVPTYERDVWEHELEMVEAGSQVEIEGTLPPEFGFRPLEDLEPKEVPADQ